MHKFLFSCLTIYDCIILYRFYVGCYPRISVSDVDLAKEIMVKEFDSFSDRGYMVSVLQKVEALYL